MTIVHKFAMFASLTTTTSVLMVEKNLYLCVCIKFPVDFKLSLKFEAPSNCFDPNTTTFFFKLSRFLRMLSFSMILFQILAYMYIFLAHFSAMLDLLSSAYILLWTFDLLFAYFCVIRLWSSLLICCLVRYCYTLLTWVVALLLVLTATLCLVVCPSICRCSCTLELWFYASVYFCILLLVELSWTGYVVVYIASCCICPDITCIYSSSLCHSVAYYDLMHWFVLPWICFTLVHPDSCIAIWLLCVLSSGHTALRLSSLAFPISSVALYVLTWVSWRSSLC